MSQRSIVVQVPATSANLGPGFDSLGVALDWTARITVTVSQQALPPPVDPIAQMAAHAATALFVQAGQGPDGKSLTARYEGDLPVGKGLGVSAAARVGGIIAADRLLGGSRSGEELLPLAARLEGHGDNAAPAMLGGLRIVAEDDGRIVQTGIDPPDDLRLAMLIPDFSMPTHESRQRLPEHLTRNQAVHNIGRAALLVAALTQRRYELLDSATRDVLHQPARAALFPAMYPIFTAARGAGAYGAYLSGGGSAIAAFVAAARADKVAGAMREAAAAHGLRAECRVVAMSPDGARVLDEDGGRP